ncbi:molybdopterin-dependent oxidoreductase [Salmonella enterica subsp. enterica]|nr:molybdopterin-dependent oxidoreductase [Salmonella enterica subsp. enterica]
MYGQHGPSRTPACRGRRSSGIAREFADNADKTHGRSMIIVGAGLNHWWSPR